MHRTSAKRNVITLAEVEAAREQVYTQMPPTAQHIWPLLGKATGATVVVKHENHTPVGSFKIRGGITFMNWLRREHPGCRGVITATRGNHGQSQARAAVAAGMVAKVLVPHGNSMEKNAAMRGFGADLIEFGDDFDEARIEAFRLATQQDLFPVPPYHRALTAGVASYALELFTAVPDLEEVYVPIGGGTGICGVISVRDALGLSTKVVAVVAKAAPCASLSVQAGELVETSSAATIADGMAVRVPVAESFAIYCDGADRFVTVSDAEIAAAMRLYFHATHNVAEGAGAAALAALMQEKDRMRGKKVGVILTGGNVDTDWFAKVLAGETPKPR